MLLSESEDVPMTAKQFASRENPGQEPQLIIDYLLRPVLSHPQVATNCCVFNFFAEPGQTYLVERATNLPATAWTPLLDISPRPDRGPITVVDPHFSGPRFYRVSTH